MNRFKYTLGDSLELTKTNNINQIQLDLAKILCITYSRLPTCYGDILIKIEAENASLFLAKAR